MKCLFSLRENFFPPDDAIIEFSERHLFCVNLGLARKASGGYHGLVEF